MIIALVAAAAVAVAPPKPLREVIYHVSYARTTGTSSVATTDHGTVTVDVMAVANNALGLKVTEHWSKNPTTLVALGTVQPTGMIVFAPRALSDVTDQLLPYFAPRFVPQVSLAPGVGWHVTDNRKTLTAKTGYVVTAVQGSSVTISVKQTLSVRDSAGTRISTTGAVVFEPRLLVPISGEFTKRLAVKISGATQAVTLRLHFDRASDTREP